jgi:hypothetical protein
MNGALRSLQRQDFFETYMVRNAKSADYLGNVGSTLLCHFQNMVRPLFQDSTSLFEQICPLVCSIKILGLMCFYKLHHASVDGILSASGADAPSKCR